MVTSWRYHWIWWLRCAIPALLFNRMVILDWRQSCDEFSVSVAFMPKLTVWSQCVFLNTGDRIFPRSVFVYPSETDSILNRGEHFRVANPSWTSIILLFSHVYLYARTFSIKSRIFFLLSLFTETETNCSYFYLCENIFCFYRNTNIILFK